MRSIFWHGIFQNVVVTFASVYEVLWCDDSHGTINLVCSSNFWICRWNPMVLPFKWNLFSSPFIWYYLLGLYLLVVIPRLQFPWPDHSCGPQQKLSMALIFIVTYFVVLWVLELNNSWRHHSKESNSWIIRAVTWYYLCWTKKRF